MNAWGNNTGAHHFGIRLTSYQDTTKPRTSILQRRAGDSASTDTIPRVPGDSLRMKTDTFHVKLSKDSLDAPVNYKAADSMVLDVPNKRIILYSKGEVKYKDIELTADSIMMDSPKDEVIASYRRDTAGKIVGKPKMKQADTEMEADFIRYNTKTQRGLTRGTITSQGEMMVQMETAKKINTTDYFGRNGIITTCNLDTPHFGFRAPKMKMVNKKLAVTGPIHPEFEGVPIPIYLPFGYFPLSQGRHSGLLAPQFTASDQFGLGLEGLGYYKVINDYFDVTLRTNIYSYGGYSVYVSPSYRRRYRYNGTFNFSYQYSRLLSSDAKQEFTTGKTFNITWNHTVDSRARPGQTFSASVNAGSTKYNQYVTNNTYRNYQNNMNSSISYSKTWGTKYNFTASANHSQNNTSTLINLNLPTIGFTVNTIYPFASQDGVGSGKWYEKLGIGLTTNAANQVSLYEKNFNMKNIVDSMQWGAQHSIPIQLSLPSLGVFTISPGVSFSEKWYSRRFTRSWNSTLNKVDTSYKNGFYAARDISFSLGASTALFGTFDKFGKDSRLVAIRHVIRPTFSLSYKPDLAAKDWYSTIAYVNGTDTTRYRYSYYDGSIYGAFSEGTFGGISFGIDNNIEAKVRSKKDTANGGIKKIKLLDGFGFNGSYNFMADSFKLSTLSLYLRSTLFDKINITAGATLDPYRANARGDRINQLSWTHGAFSPGRITNGNIAVSTSFQSKSKDDKKSKGTGDESGFSNSSQTPMTPEEQLEQLAYARQNPAEFADFNVPWSVSMSFSLSFSRLIKSDYSGWYTNTSSNLSLNGDFNITPKWKVGMNTYYDFNTSAIQSLTMYISREMHCWQMSINVTPVGLYRTFNITINPKSGLLRDLKINRTRYFYGQ